MAELLATKLYMPRLRSKLVSRPRLTARLNAGLDKTLTLIAAPAGFGKTTLLSEWIPQSPRCVTWLALDAGDNDPTKFWAYVIASVQQIHPDLGAGARDLLQSPQAPPITAIITALVNDIAAFPDRFATVLDDYQVISFQPIHEALTYLIDHLPRNCHLVITTRADPLLRLARLRARDQLNEFRANDLRFTEGETAAFLTQAMGLSLAPEQVAVLNTRTEGWISGLKIAALSMQGTDDIPGFLQTFSGSHRHILAYLAEEVLDQRPKGTLNFLLQTSILDRLTGPLCDAVTGDSGGQTMLEDLEHANLFITALDEEGRWYRYHHLFAEVLQARLQRTWANRVPELHRRAAIWYAQQGVMDEAVRHALAGADYNAAARLIEAVAGEMLRRGAGMSLMRWLDAMPEETVRARPRLCLARGWTLQMGPTLDLDRAEDWAQLALRTAAANGALDSDLSGEAVALQAMIAATRGEMGRSRELGIQAERDLSHDSPWRSAIAFCLGTAHMDAGDMDAATHAFGEAIRLSGATGAYYVQLAAGSFLADIQVSQGHLGRAMELYQQVLAWADPNLPQKGSVMAHAGQASVLYERDQLDAALAHVLLGADQVDQVGGAWSAHVLNTVLAHVHQARGNATDALAALDRSYQIGNRAQVSLVVTRAAALIARQQLAQGDLAAAEAWAADNGLNPDDPQTSHAGLREVEYLTLARVLDAQGRHGQALSLLQRLLQSAQVEGRTGSVITILALQALIVQTQGNTDPALALLERALTLAEPEGYVRVFVDEGAPMRVLLNAFQTLLRERRSDGQLLAYTDTLLAAFPRSPMVATQGPGTPVEQLSAREMEVLRLIAKGFTNQEIAASLVIAVSTVKSHINTLYAKLGTHRRTEAVAIARDLGLL